MNLLMIAVLGFMAVMGICSIVFGHYDDKLKDQAYESIQESIEKAERGPDPDLVETVKRMKYRKWTQLTAELQDIAGRIQHRVEERVYYAPSFNELSLA